MLKKFVLDDTAVNYIISELGHGRGLAQRLSRLSLHEGRVFTHLPEETPTEDLHDFESGAVGSGRENSKIADLIQKSFRSPDGDQRVCVFEYASARKGDPLPNRTIPIFTVDEDVYLFSDSKTGFDRIQEMVRLAHVYPAIGLVSQIPQTQLPKEGESADAHFLDLLAASPLYLFVGAYDAEGWLTWTPRDRRDST